ncbi:hypothetical protein R1flu_012539 [Riccia fluitans]|uniref:Uncharacterized protein n=1 Tax=Riccia fluitans TaxID=41844 RepID=A0ABD1ZAX2_9MARC
MFTPGAWTVLVLKKMQLGRSQESCCDEPQFGQEEGFYNKMLWAIPEDEEDSVTKKLWAIPEDEEVSVTKARTPIQLMKNGSPHKGRDCNCNKKNGNNNIKRQLMVKPRFSSSIKQMRRNARVANAEIDYKAMKRTDDKYPFQLSLVSPSKRFDEDELSYECDEISQVHLAMSQGKLSLDNLRILRI